VCIFTTQLPPEKISRHGAVARKWKSVIRALAYLAHLVTVLLLPLVKGALGDPKVPHDVFGLTTTLMLLYGLDDLALIESTCFHYPKNQNLSF
jgi:hypothetical protein